MVSANTLSKNAQGGGPLESAQNGKSKKWRRKCLIQKEVQNLQFIPANN
jgi:hypothetical protein